MLHRLLPLWLVSLALICGAGAALANPAGADDLGRLVAVPTNPKRLLAFFEVSPTYKSVRHIMRQACEKHELEYELLKAVIATESGFQQRALSSRGAVGLMQITPVTAQRFGLAAEPRDNFALRLADPQTNIHIGAQYLAHLMRLFKGNRELALAAYNAGEGTVLRAGQQIPDIVETRHFVETVMHLYFVLKPHARPSIPRVKPAAVTPAAPATDWY